MNFAVASEVADSVELCLFDEAGAETRLPLQEYDAGVWHGFVPGHRTRAAVRLPRRPGRTTRPVASGATRRSCCSTRMRRRSRARSCGTSGSSGTSGRSARTAATTSTRPPRCRARWSSTRALTGPATRPPAIPYPDTVIYETHVKGLTRERIPHVPAELQRHLRGAGAPGGDRAPDRARRDRGGAAAGAPVGHQRRAAGAAGWPTTGATTPSASSRRTPATRQRRRPAGRAARSGSSSRWCGRCTRLGSRCVLDVVFNHTAEGNEYGPTLCLARPGQPRLLPARAGCPRHYFDYHRHRKLAQRRGHTAACG